MGIQIAVQLYTVRDQAEKDFIGTLEKISEIGYQGVEFAGYGGLSAGELAKVLERLHLKACGTHVGIDQVTQHLDEVIAYNKEIGNKHIICPWADVKTREDFINMGKLFNTVGEKCAKEGLVFGYHNHDFEFTSLDGEYGLDIMFAACAPANVKAELDIFWVRYAGEDPVKYIRKYAGRCPLIHIKDMDSLETRYNTEIGNGIMDFHAIHAAAKDAGVEWLVVELDECPRPSIESISISFENLKKMNLI